MHIPPNRFVFNTTLLASLPVPRRGKRHYYHDRKERGLVLDMRASGSMSFYLYKKIDGRQEKIWLGIFPDLSIGNARKKAAILKGEIASGKNPQEEKRAIRNEMLFAQLFDRYMTLYSRPHKKTWRDDEREINKYAVPLLNKRLSAISRNDMVKLHVSIATNHGPVQANQVIKRVKAIFNKAEEWGWKGSNPAKGIKKFREQSRARFILPEEMPRFLKALDGEQDRDFQDFIRLLLLTGTRKSKLLAMEFAHVNLPGQQWHIPETKNGDPLTIPLLPEAVRILQRRQAESGGSVFAFPNDRTKSGHMDSPKRKWRELLQRAEMTDLWMHDLRRTFGSYQAITGTSLHIIGKSLGHKSPQATQIYARLDLDPVRASMAKATGAMLALAS